MTDAVGGVQLLKQPCCLCFAVRGGAKHEPGHKEPGHLHTHPKNSQVWFPNRTVTVLPAPRFSPMMVTLVPPDSGPRLGDSPATVGVWAKDAEKQR